MIQRLALRPHCNPISVSLPLRRTRPLLLPLVFGLSLPLSPSFLLLSASTLPQNRNLMLGHATPLWRWWQGDCFLCRNPSVSSLRLHQTPPPHLPCPPSHILSRTGTSSKTLPRAWLRIQASVNLSTKKHSLKISLCSFSHISRPFHVCIRPASKKTKPALPSDSCLLPPLAESIFPINSPTPATHRRLLLWRIPLPPTTLISHRGMVEYSIAN